MMPVQCNREREGSQTDKIGSNAGSCDRQVTQGTRDGCVQRPSDQRPCYAKLHCCTEVMRPVRLPLHIRPTQLGLQGILRGRKPSKCSSLKRYGGRTQCLRLGSSRDGDFSEKFGTLGGWVVNSVVEGRGESTVCWFIKKGFDFQGIVSEKSPATIIPIIR